MLREYVKETKFSMPVIFVEDIQISKKFYQNLFSLEVEMDFGQNIVFKEAFSIWEKNRAKEIIFQNKLIDQEEKRYNNVELYFETLDIQSIWEKILSSKVEIIHPIKEEAWGQRAFRVYDPDKFIIEVAEPMAEVVKRLSKLGLSRENISIKTQMALETIVHILDGNS